MLELEPGAGSRIAAEEAGERDRAPHAERRPLEPRRLAMHGERGVDARSAAEAAGAAGVAPEPLVEVTDRICLLDRLDVGVDESRPAVVAARHVDAVAVPRAAGADGVPVHDEEGGRAVPRRQPEARGPAGRGDTLGEATAAERAGDRLLETRLAELHRHQPDVHVRGGDRRRRPRVHDRALGRDDAHGLQDAVRERDVGGEDLVHAHDELRADDLGLRVEEVRALRRRPRVVEQQLPVADAQRAADEKGLLVELDPALRAVLAPRQLADPGLQHPG